MFPLFMIEVLYRIEKVYVRKGLRRYLNCGAVYLFSNKSSMKPVEERVKTRDLEF